jgi:hypothetical protein
MVLSPTFIFIFPLKVSLNLSSDTTYVGLGKAYFGLSFVFFCCGREKEEEEENSC